MPPRRSNTEFIHHLMTTSPTGNLTQLFVIGAISYMAEKVGTADDQALEDLLAPLVSADAWRETAAYIRAELDKQYLNGGTSC